MSLHQDSHLYLDIEPEQWPIIYRPEYNVHFMGLERVHPFDARKWENIVQLLEKSGIINERDLVMPNEATKEDLMVVHSKKYLRSLKCSYKVAYIAEIFPMAFIPNWFIQRGYLKRMRYQTGGSILAGKLALERGWAINIGGGFHHCSSKKGGGFCPYADITLLIHFVFNNYPQRVKNVMIVDLDAHQGNGYEHDFKDNENVYVMDVYNRNIYPVDVRAKTYINRKVELLGKTEDEEYLKKVEENLDAALGEFTPQLVVYNAGTDILKGDSLGNLSISPEGIILRDELVFSKVRSKGIPIVMLTSGGYHKKSAKVVASSIYNLKDAKLIGLDDRSNY